MKPNRYSDPLKGFMRYGEKTLGYTLTIFVVAALIMAWMITDQFFQSYKHVAQKVKRPSKKRICKPCALHDDWKIGFALTISWVAVVFFSSSEQIQAQIIPGETAIGIVPTFSHTNLNIWQTDVGAGFKPGAQSISIGLGAGYGLKILGSQQSHDLALISISYGQMIGPVQGAGHWYRGNWELRGELFTGAQFSPSTESLVGLTPHLRYNFATITRWIPFVDAGAGVSATSIGPPDLSGTFEFNLQAATGVRWFIRDDFALGIEARYLHLSCAGTHPPNLGLNNVGGMISASWFF